MAPLLEAIRTNDRQKATEWAHSEHWATVEQLISATAASSHSSPGVTFGNTTHSSSSSGIGGIGIGVGSGPVNPPPEQPLWTCPHCTFLNPGELSSCEMCSLPR